MDLMVLHQCEWIKKTVLNPVQISYVTTGMQRNGFWKTGKALVNASNDHLMGSASGLNFMLVLMVTPDDLNIFIHRLKYIADIKGTARIFFFFFCQRDIFFNTHTPTHTPNSRTLFFHLCNITNIRNIPSQSNGEKLVHISFLRLDYGNSLLSVF